MSLHAVPGPPPPLQGSLLASGEPVPDCAFSTVRRLPLPPGGWVDHAPEWLRGADALFHDLVGRASWRSREVTMWGNRVVEPRLHASLHPSEVPALTAVAEALERRYGVAFDRAGLNYYRDGHDSVAWHGDRLGRRGAHALVCVLAVGGRRPFLLRPAGGGSSLRFELGRGDLLVMGGSAQRAWQHAVPKVSQAEPRISITFRSLIEKPLK